MHPILFTIPGLDFPIRSFGVMVLLGFVLGTHLLTRWYLARSSDPERDAEGIAALPIWIMVGVIGGARLVYVAVEVARGSEVGQSFLDDPFRIFAVWKGGLVMYGGIFGAIAMGLWCTKKHRMRFPHVLDLGITAGFFGLAVGRVGCLLVGDDFGSVVTGDRASLPFPLTVTVPSLEWLQANQDSLWPHELAGQVVWATQPWMSANALMLGFLGMALLRRRRYPGQVALQLLAVYSIGRYVIELFRGDEIRGVWFGGQSTSQLVSIALFCIVVPLLWRDRRRREAYPPPTPAGPGGVDSAGATP